MSTLPSPSGSLRAQPVLAGTGAADVLRGTDAGEALRGEGGDDYLFGEGGDDSLTGGLGRDVLDGGTGTNTFVYGNLLDSYRGSGENHTDLIRHLADTGDNRIDLSALGFSFTGLGNGENHTLAVSVNDAGTRTYVKSYVTDADGYRFEIAFEGDISGYFTEDRFIFAAPSPLPTITGTSEADVLLGQTDSELIRGGAGDDYLSGGGGDDYLYGGDGDDMIVGGSGRDVLYGGSGANTFVYTFLTQSYHAGDDTAHTDRIQDFAASSDNRIDVSAMGFTGFGNGHAHTLDVVVNDAGTRTYLKSYAYDEGGDRFELAFEGDVSHYLTEDHIIFASKAQGMAAQQGSGPVLPDNPAGLELLGVPENPPADAVA